MTTFNVGEYATSMLEAVKSGNQEQLVEVMNALFEAGRQTGYDNTNRGGLWINHKRTKENSPDLQGYIDINGTEFFLSGWTHTSKKGEHYIKLMLGDERKPQDESQDDTSTETSIFQQ